MAGFAGELANRDAAGVAIDAMSRGLTHRGPDDEGVVRLPDFWATHRRLSIIDLSEQGSQPFRRGTLTLLFNGEIYNYLELRQELEGKGVRFSGESDSEVLLEAFRMWGQSCLSRLLGMFAFVVWDETDRSLFLARDRFGVKPLYLCQPSAGSLVFASEIGTLQAAGYGREPDSAVWGRFLVDGASERGTASFWSGIERLGAGEMAIFRNGELRRSRWYDLAARVQQLGEDQRSDGEVRGELEELLEASVALRFRADVPVGVNLSGGLDSSLLLALVQRTQGVESDLVRAFTFTCGDQRYDELPWVRAMLQANPQALTEVRLSAAEVPELARSVARSQREPAGGLATLAYAKLFEVASADGIKVLLDGQGVDETWAGYDYYQSLIAGEASQSSQNATFGNGVAPLQGTTSSPTRPSAISPELAAVAAGEDHRESAQVARGLSPLVQRQLFDLLTGKLPRALRYNDRVSMRASVELREPFLDHRLVELGLRQPGHRKISDGRGKALPRKLASKWLPAEIGFAPKRALQTPQREWLRGPLRDWTEAQIDRAKKTGWLREELVDEEWRRFRDGTGDNSFFIWQWIDLGLLVGGRV